MPSRRTQSPVNEGGGPIIPQAAPDRGEIAPTVMAPPAPPEAETIEPKFDRLAVMESGNFTFRLDIISVMAAQLNYDPEKATGNLNATLQDTLATATGIFDIPTNMYNVSFEPPGPAAGSEEKGRFVCQIPGNLSALVKHNQQVVHDLGFTGDDHGNRYKLKYAEDVLMKKKSSKRPKNDTYWFHLIPDEPAMVMPRRSLYEKTNDHLAKYGMKIMEHEKAFEPKLTQDKEQQDGRKFHVEYELDPMRVPVKYGYMDVVGLNHINFDPEIDGATGKLWFHEDLLEKVFGACKVCYRHKALCLGHEARPKSNAAGKRPAAASDQANAAKRRIAAKAAQKGNFAF